MKKQKKTKNHHVKPLAAIKKTKKRGSARIKANDPCQISCTDGCKPYCKDNCKTDCKDNCKATCMDICKNTVQTHTPSPAPVDNPCNSTGVRYPGGPITDKSRNTRRNAKR